MKTIKNYWISEKTYIFKNHKDALLGFLVLIVMPAISIVLILSVEEYTFWNYTFPLLSIALAGIYDAYGRYEEKAPRNTKLLVRAILDAISIFFAALCLGIENLFLSLISPVFLLLNGIMLIYEMYNRVKAAIIFSPWSMELRR